ncbi:MAG: DUF481 domain-containing protein [Pseudomonadales bacterium]
MRIDAKQIVWKSPILGELKVPKDQVLTLNSDTYLEFQKASGEADANCKIRVEHGDAIVSCNKEEIQQSTLNSIKAEPPQPAWNSDGRIDLSVERDKGNVDEQEFESNVQVRLQHGQFAHEFDFEAEHETSDDEIKEEEYEVAYQLDRFFKPSRLGWYGYSRLEWDKDRFRLPEEWVSLGIGLGYQWRYSKAVRFRAQLGIDHWELDGVTEAVKRSATGGRWVLDFSYLFPRIGDLTLFHRQEGVWEIQEPANFFLEAKTGLRLPIRARLYIEVSIDYENNSTTDEIDVPPDNTEWNLGLGYRW